MFWSSEVFFVVSGVIYTDVYGNYCSVVGLRRVKNYRLSVGVTLSALFFLFAEQIRFCSYLRLWFVEVFTCNIFFHPLLKLADAISSDLINNYNITSS